MAVCLLLWAGVTRGVELPYAYVDSVVTITHAAMNGDSLENRVIAVGSSNIVVGLESYAPPGSTAGPYGALMVFDFSGTLLNTITNESVQEPDTDSQRIELETRSGSTFFVSKPIRPDGETGGVLYVMDLEGNLLNTIKKPVSCTDSNQWFGRPIRRVGSDEFLVSTFYHDPSGTIRPDCETQCIYAMDGDGQTLFALSRIRCGNDIGDTDSTAMGAIPGDRYMIATLVHERTPGVDLYDASGAFLKSLTPPPPVLSFGLQRSEDFGYEIQALGTNLFVISEPSYYEQPPQEYILFLYDRDGNLLNKIRFPGELDIGTDPSAEFGKAVAPLSEDIFAVGAPGVNRQGMVVLFNTAGKLLQAITPPGPSTSFGSQVFGAGTNRLVIVETGKVHIYELSFGLTDPFEPDNTSSQARAFPVGREEMHSFHSPGDEDWIRLYLTTNYNYLIETDTDSTNVDVVLNVFFQQTDGTLTPVSTDVNLNPRQANGLGGESLDLIPQQNGTYLVNTKNSDPDAFGEDNTYGLKVTAATPAPPTALVVVAVDLLSPGGEFSPPGTQIIIDGGTPVPMNGANTMVFTESSVPAIVAGGTHTVEVRVPTGYLALEDPVEPGAVANPLNPLFGNPKQVNIVVGQWNFYVYGFLPSINVSGRLRDAFSGGWLDGAYLTFISSSGPLLGLYYDQYPLGASYAPPWLTDASGNFPTNIILPNGNWNFSAFHQNFGLISISNLIMSPGPGASTNFNFPPFTPADANSNRIADAWEMAYFYGLISGLGDADFDGFNDRTEYRLGTNPIDDTDTFAFGGGMAQPGQNRLTFSWPVSGGRSYGVRCTPSLSNTNWVPVFGPWTAPSNGTMSVQTTNHSERQLYRLDAFLP